MKKIFGALLALVSSVAFGTTTVPVQLLNPTGSSSGQAIVSTGASSAPAWGGVGVNGIAAIAANTVLANVTGSSASPTAATLPGCSTGILQYTLGTGFSCSQTVAALQATGTVTAAAISGLTTPLSVAQGGTGRATLTAHGVLLGEGTSAINQTAAGSAGQILISGGASADPAWSSLGQPYFSAYNSASQSLTTNTWTKVTFNTKNYDSGGYYDNTTNYRFTPLIAGKYHVTMSVELTGSVSTANVFWQGAIYKNGSQLQLNANSLYGNSGTLIVTPTVSADVVMNGTTDYIEGWVYCGATTCTTGSGSLYSVISAYYIGP